MAVSFIGGGNFQQYFSYIVTVSFIGGGNHHNISVISWWSVLLVEETVVQYFSYIVVVSFIGGGNRSTIFQLYRGGQFYWWRKPQYFSYIVAVSFIGGGNQRKPLTCCKSLTNFIAFVVHLALIEIRTHNISGDKH